MITIDESRTGNLSKNSQENIKNYYLQENETIQEGYGRAAMAYTSHNPALSQRIYDYVSKKWFMYASPVFSNAPRVGEKFKGMPISCFLTYVPDTLEGLISHTDELRWMSVKGGGVGGHWSDIRSVSDVAPSPIPFLKTIDADMMAYCQGKTRKGSYAAYMDISHPDIVEFINMRIPTGDVNRKCLNLHHGVNITDDFMFAVKADEDWDLIDPNDKTVRDTVKARDLWERILETRYRTGEPYILFIDTAQRAIPQKDFMKLRGSNLCLSGNTTITVRVCNSNEICMTITLEEFVNNVQSDIKWEILSFNEKTQQNEWKLITNCGVTGINEEVIKVTDEETNKTITCTPNHEIYTQNRGYVKACELNKDDILKIAHGGANNSTYSGISNEDIIKYAIKFYKNYGWYNYKALRVYCIRTLNKRLPKSIGGKFRKPVANKQIIKYLQKHFSDDSISVLNFNYNQKLLKRFYREMDESWD